MTLNSQLQKAEELRKLHHGPEVLILPNIWDVVGACIVEAAGAKAIATSSAAIAFALGYPDGERISRREMLEVVARIARAVSLPVTADLEAGYGDSCQETETLTHELIATGAVGLNLEDGAEHPPRLRPLELQLEKIRIIRQASAQAGVPLVINARTDIYLLQIGDPKTRFAEAVRRGRAFREAGADCVFVPGVHELAIIAALVKEIDAPINILAQAQTPPAPELKKIGVARLSIGAAAGRATLGLLRQIAHELLTLGTYRFMTPDVPSYAEVNAMLENRSAAIPK